MAVGLLFGGFWYGLGVLLWWWPAAVFVAFSNDDVTPGARGFAVGAIFLGAVLATLDVAALGVRFAVPGTVLTVGVLLLMKPVGVLGAGERSPLTPRQLGTGFLVAGLGTAVLIAM